MTWLRSFYFNFLFGLLKTKEVMKSSFKGNLSRTCCKVQFYASESRRVSFPSSVIIFLVLKIMCI